MPVDAKRAYRPPMRKKSYKLKSLDIEVATNGGFSVRCRKVEPESEGGDGMSMAYQEPELKTFGDYAALRTFLDTTFDGAATKATAESDDEDA